MKEKTFRKSWIFPKKSDCSICYSCNSLDPPLEHNIEKIKVLKVFAVFPAVFTSWFEDRLDKARPLCKFIFSNCLKAFTGN